MELIKKCKQKLQHSENKFKEIKEKFEETEKNL
jgi:exonuclease VII small subunit